MATVIYIPEKRQSPSAMAGLIRYCCQEHKVTDELGRHYVSGVNCDGDHALTEFLVTKKAFGKTGGTNFYQYVQSFSPREELTYQEAHSIALEFAARAWPGHEVLVTTHCDAPHPHSHFIINSVSCETGYKLRQSPGTLKKLRTLSDEICAAHGLSSPKPKQNGGANISAREYRAAEKGESWKFRLETVIDAVMDRCGSREDFIREMRRHGYELTWTPERKNITYRCPNGKKCRDARLHEEKYLKEKMERELAIRKRILEKLQGTARAVTEEDFYADADTWEETGWELERVRYFKKLLEARRDREWSHADRCMSKSSARTFPPRVERALTAFASDALDTLVGGRDETEEEREQRLRAEEDARLIGLLLGVSVGIILTVAGQGDPYIAPTHAESAEQNGDSIQPDGNSVETPDDEYEYDYDTYDGPTFGGM